MSPAFSRVVPIIGAWILLGACANAGDDAAAGVIEKAHGVDQRVDYASLSRFGPWDDRNYGLTLEDLDLLAPNEHELHDPIPAFFRVELRKEMPHLRRSGQGQYPRAAVPLFQNRYGELQQKNRPDTGDKK